MAEVISIRIIEDPDDESHTTLGNCSNPKCNGLLIEDPDFGFPACCPHCKQPLVNGIDKRECLEQRYYHGSGTSA